MNTRKALLTAAFLSACALSATPAEAAPATRHCFYPIAPSKNLPTPACGNPTAPQKVPPLKPDKTVGGHYVS